MEPLDEEIWWDFLNDLTDGVYEITGYQPLWNQLTSTLVVMTINPDIFNTYSPEELTVAITPRLREITDYHQYFILEKVRVIDRPQPLIILTIKVKTNYLTSIPQELFRLITANLSYTPIIKLCNSSIDYYSNCTDTAFWKDLILLHYPHLQNNLHRQSLNDLKRLYELLSETGIPYGYGYNGDAGLGVIPPSLEVTTFTRISVDNIIDVACGESHSVFLNNKGKLYTCGSAQNGQLGTITPNAYQSSPVPLDLPQKIVQISCGDYNTAAITEKGTLYTFGMDNYLERRTTTPYLVPSITKAVQVSYGRLNYVVVTEEGQLYIGGNSIETDVARGIPRLVTTAAENFVISAAVGYNYIAYIDINRKLYVAKINTDRNLYLASFVEIDQEEVPLPSGETGVLQVTVGVDAVYYITTKYNLYAINITKPRLISKQLDNTQDMKITQIFAQRDLLVFTTEDNDIYSYHKLYYHTYGGFNRIFPPGLSRLSKTRTPILKVTCGSYYVIALHTIQQ